MNTPLSRPNTQIPSQPARDTTPRRLIVTASVVIFAVRDWSLWALVREGPWGPPMRVVLGNESITDAVDRTVAAVLMWPQQSRILQLKAGWQEQQISVWGSADQGAAVTLIHSVLLQANRDELRPNLHQHPVPSLRVHWVPVIAIESTNQYTLDPDVHSVVQSAIYTLRSQVQRDPEIVLGYLADMGHNQPLDVGTESEMQDTNAVHSKEALSLNALKDPVRGDGILTLAEAALLYRAFFPPDEQIDLSNLRRRFLLTNKLEPLDEEQPVRGRELDWRRVSKAYRYHPAGFPNTKERQDETQN